jgi:RNA binding exosome subunit
MRGEVDVIIHATEDYNKVISSIQRVLGIKIKRMERRDLSGHYGNPLIYCKIKLDSSQTKDLLRNISVKLDDVDRFYLMNNLDEYFDGNTLYLRLDKQMLCKNILKLVVNDPLKIVIKNINLDTLRKLLFE